MLVDDTNVQLVLRELQAGICNETCWILLGFGLILGASFYCSVIFDHIQFCLGFTPFSKGFELSFAPLCPVCNTRLQEDSFFK